MTNRLTVADELKRRDDCRYGLYGVRVQYGQRELFVTASEWDCDGELVLHLADELPRTELRMMTLRELLDEVQAEPASATIRAADCILISEWPEVCGCWK